MTTPLNPCPAWCGLPSGHDFEASDTPGWSVRGHEVAVGRVDSARVDVTLSADELVAGDGSTLVDEAVLALQLPNDSVSLDAAGARALAALLTDAAGRLEVVRDGGQ